MEGRLSVQRGLQIPEVLPHQRKIAFTPFKFIAGHILAGMQQQLLGAGGFGNGIRHQPIGKLDVKNRMRIGFLHLFN